MIYRALWLLPTMLLWAPGARATDGCAPGDTSVTYSPDGKAVSVIFNSFLAAADEPATCNLAVPAQLPDSAIAVYKADYRGFTEITDGQTLRLAIVTSTGNEMAVVTGPFADDTLHTGRLGSGAGGSIGGQISLDILPDGSDPNSIAEIDTLDLVELGRTTISSVEDSIIQLSDQQAGVIVNLDTTAARLLGFDAPLEAPNSLTLEAAAGSATLDIKANYNLEDGFSLHGGAAFVVESNGSSGVRSQSFVAASLRFVDPEQMVLRPFGEAGVWGSPGLAIHFSRTYAGGAVAADATGSLLSVFGRAGVLYAPDVADQLVFSATLAQSWLQTSAHDEIASVGNLFPAHIDAGSFASPTVKASGTWTHAMTPDIDATLSAAVGRTFGRSAIIADVDWLGPVTIGAEDVTFAQFGARFGVRVRQATSVNVFAVDTVGDKIPNHFQVGGGVKISF